MNPRFPIYIPSKGRWQSRITMRWLISMGIPFHTVVEPAEYEAYAAVLDPACILTLDMSYKDRFETLDQDGDTKSKGPGPARNFAWDHAVASGAEFHWVMDDNIRGFYRLYRNTQVKFGDGTPFRMMEDFVLRYTNIAMAGPNYDFFCPIRQGKSPYTLNTRIYSCNLIRNDAPFRWRGRYNEDTDLSLRMLKAGWCTVQFNAMLQKKVTTQTMQGGNTDAFYASEGTLPKSRMLVAAHPDVTRLTWRFSRWHHYVDYRRFRRNRLHLKPGLTVPQGADDYGMHLVHLTRRAA